MALYLGNKHISEFYLGDKKIKEAYIGNKKVYPEKEIIIPGDEELIFQIIFTDSEGNTYDQLAFRNELWGRMYIPHLQINASPADPYIGNSLSDNNTITENLNDINQALIAMGENLAFLYLAAHNEDSNSNYINNSLGSIRGITSLLREFLNSGTDIEVNENDGDWGIDFLPVQISDGYALLGRKNGTGNRVVICDSTNFSNVSINKVTIQNNIVRAYYKFNGTTTPTSTIDFKIIFTDSDGSTYDQLAFRNIATGETLIPHLDIKTTVNINTSIYTGSEIVNDTITEPKEDIISVLEGEYGNQCLIGFINGNNSLNIFTDLASEIVDDINNSTGVETDLGWWEFEKAALDNNCILLGRKDMIGNRITICENNSEDKINLNKLTIQGNTIRAYYVFNGTTSTPTDNFIFKVFKETDTGLHNKIRGKQTNGGHANLMAYFHISDVYVTTNEGDYVTTSRDYLEGITSVNSYISSSLSGGYTLRTQEISINTSDIMNSPNGNINFTIVDEGYSNYRLGLQYYDESDESWKSFAVSSAVDRVIRNNNEIHIIYS